MQPLPHNYSVQATATESSIELGSPGLNPIPSAPPVEFGGPGNMWSPETLMVAAVADCFILTFRAIANASKLRWKACTCSGNGTVDRSDGVTRFVEIRLNVNLAIAESSDEDRARRLLDKAHRACVVGNSLKCEPILDARITVA